MTSSSEAMAAGRRPRRRNRRGEGALLRDEIIEGATAVLERTGSEETVSLRAVAREVGIAAPSIIRHFKDHAEIIDAVVAREAAVLVGRMSEAFASTDDPLGRLVAVGRAYVTYGREFPSRYRVLVGRRYLDAWEQEGRVMEQSDPVLREGIAVVANSVQGCIDAGLSTGTDALLGTAVLWFTLHGLIVVPQAITSVAWPEDEELFMACINRAAGIRPVPPGPAGRRARPPER